jgi:cysteinyl-tRNA synthetase
MRKLNCMSPRYEPRVTDNMPEIVEFIDGLIKAGKAYAVDGDVYYSISSFPEYGKLSKQKIDDLVAGARVEKNEKKQDVLDFALWKSEPEGTFWESPWGYGRPGWHIECSALAKKFLGEQIDLHAGGMDLIFPHHENEVAQSEGLHNVPFARYWMHNAFVQVKKEKMSKSLGNFFTLRDVFAEFDPMVIRYYILTHHYRAPLDFSFDDITAVEKSYRRLCALFATVGEQPAHEVVVASLLVKKMLTFLVDDINTVGMLGVVFEHIDVLRTDESERACVKALLQQVLGVTLVPLAEKSVEITPEIQALLDAREQARVDKNWARADELRTQLTAMGVDLKDKKLN